MQTKGVESKTGRIRVEVWPENCGPAEVDFLLGEAKKARGKLRCNPKNELEDLGEIVVKVALVHDWLDKYAGSERVLEQILELFPAADLFSLVEFLAERGFIKHKKVHTSFLQKLPLAKRYFRYYLPLFPLAIESLDLSAYDLIISSSHCVAKAVKKREGQIHISYVHTPIRYAWDLRNQYLEELGWQGGIKGFLANLVLDYLKGFDLKSADRVDYYVANSRFVRERIKNFYGKEAVVIYPPVDVNRFKLEERKEDFYLVVARLEPYKKVHLIVEAFNRMPERRLVIIGEGSQMNRIKGMARKNVEVLGYQPEEEVVKFMERAKAFVYAAVEDFGMVLVEAQAAGTPVVAYRKGGASEVVIEGKTGRFFDAQRPEAVVEAIKELEKTYDRFNLHEIRQNSLRFRVERFRREFVEFVKKVLIRKFNLSMDAQGGLESPF